MSWREARSQRSSSWSRSVSEHSETACHLFGRLADLAPSSLSTDRSDIGKYRKLPGQPRTRARPHTPAGEWKPTRPRLSLPFWSLTRRYAKHFGDRRTSPQRFFQVRANTILMVSDIAMITKTGKGRVVNLVVNRATGQPVAAAKVALLARDQSLGEAATNADGIAEMPLAAARPNDIRVVARSNRAMESWLVKR